MEVKSCKNFNDTYVYYMRDGQKELRISFEGNLDLYWSFADFSSEGEVTYGDFVIKKEDGLPYRLLEGLFTSIQNADPFEYCAEVRHSALGDITAVMYDFSRIDMYKALFDGEKITWVSDDRDLENNHVVQISKQDGAFLLEFAKKKKEYESHYCHDYSRKHINIRFRNSGSFYNPFNCVFMKMYNDLGGYSTEFGELPARDLSECKGQMHIEDLVLKK